MKTRLFSLVLALVLVAFCCTAFSLSAYASNTLDSGDIVSTYYYTDSSPSPKRFDNTISLSSSLSDFYVWVVVKLSSPIPSNKPFNWQMLNVSSTANADLTSLELFDANGNAAATSCTATVINETGMIGIQITGGVADLGEVAQIEYKLHMTSPSWIVTNLPKFTLGGETYYFELGMTWADWVESKYNTDNFIISSATGQIIQYQSLDSYCYVDGQTANLAIVDKKVYDLVLYEPEPETTEPPSVYYEFAGPGTFTLPNSLSSFMDSFWLSNPNGFDFEFTSNGTTYSGIYMPSSSIFAYKGYNGASNQVVYSSGAWETNSYRYISFSICEGCPEWFYNLFQPYYSFTSIGGGGANDYGYGDEADSPGWDDPYAPMLISGSSAVIYNFSFSPYQITYSLQTEEEVTGGIFGFVKKIWQSIANLPTNIANSIKAFFDMLGEKISALGNTILDGIKNLFVPSESDILDVKTNFEILLSDRFGAVYDSAEIIDDFASVFMTSGVSATSDNTISFPSVTVPLAGVDYTFGGWEVDIIPKGFEDMQITLKLITSVVCTFMFINGLRKRLEDVL